MMKKGKISSIFNFMLFCFNCSGVAISWDHIVFFGLDGLALEI